MSCTVMWRSPLKTESFVDVVVVGDGVLRSDALLGAAFAEGLEDIFYICFFSMEFVYLAI